MCWRGPRRPRTKSAIVSRISVSRFFASTSIHLPCTISASPSFSILLSLFPPSITSGKETARGNTEGRNTHTHTHTPRAHTHTHTHHRKGDSKRQLGRAQHACQGTRTQSPPYWGGSGQGVSCVRVRVHVRVRVSMTVSLTVFVSVCVCVSVYFACMTEAL